MHPHVGPHTHKPNYLSMSDPLGSAAHHNIKLLSRESPLPCPPYFQNATVRGNKQSFETGFSHREDVHLVRSRFAEQEVHFPHLKVITSNKLQGARAAELKTIGFAVIRKTQGNDDCGTTLKGTLTNEGPSFQFILQLEYLEIHN